MPSTQRFDFLVIGSGIAGLFFFDGEQIDLANQQFKHLYADEYAGHEVGHLNFDVPSLSREGFVDVMLV